ncbi:hypothetical protein QBC34DRAFT_400126 [Podospora aff. communis PSN243]|uniref:Sm domain-containing protein n=1 Tax=Podospora aff. communis PSN243 TaxID=3040156 RepID=A0AAV9GUA1_9PEZI|nr:hypothetical protein QBC34DRAFT_400126 [Podospora aff. communis PSN243]
MSTDQPPPPPPSKAESTAYLHSLLNKNLRITTTDSRMFWGGFKCTDSESNIILKHTYEYRHPSLQRQAEEIAASGVSTVKMDMTSRYLGLVVVPGRHIVKIEAEEFVSQMRMGPAVGSVRLGALAGVTATSSTTSSSRSSLVGSGGGEGSKGVI